MTYRFHASAPKGEWINDPNALFFARGRYHLFAQHAADAPDFRRIGWGHFSSADLLNWDWQGVVMPPQPDASIYSGSLVMTDPPELFFTRHDYNGPWQTQARAVLAADLAGATPIGGALGPAGRNLRDPFVWRANAGWRMLLARPCDWTVWPHDPPSTLELWGSPDRLAWQRLAVVGPWMAPGILWEVPALLDFGDVQALLISLVDRRDGTSACEVRYWLGRLDDGGFSAIPNFPPDGIPLDHGPDFYAAIPNTVADWPGPDRVVIGWASSWATARAVSWPENRGGGPISLPRRVRLAGDRLTIDPGVPRPPDWSGSLATGDVLRLATNAGRLAISTPGELRVERDGFGLPAFSRTAPLPPAGDDHASIYLDGPLAELFWRGITISAVLPGGGQITVMSDREY